MLDTVKNIAGKVGGFIGKVTPIICNVDNIMSYLLEKLDTIGKSINRVVDNVDSIARLLRDGLRGKVEQCRGRRLQTVS
jgi:hypothetical protein